LPVQQCLLSKTPRAKITKLFVHPQSLAQCRGWIQIKLPQAEIIETSSNARSAELSAKEKNTAALSREFSALKNMVSTCGRRTSGQRLERDALSRRARSAMQSADGE